MSIKISSKFEGQLLPEIKLSISRPCWNTRWNTKWNTHRNFCRILQVFQNLQKKRILTPWMMPKNHDLNKIKQNTFCQKYANTKKHWQEFSQSYFYFLQFFHDFSLHDSIFYDALFEFIALVGCFRRNLWPLNVPNLRE